MTKKIFIHIIFAAAAASLGLNGCKKSDDHVLTSSLNVINATPGINTVLVRTPNVTGYFSQMAGVGYGASAVFNIPTGAVPISMIDQGDTIKPFYGTTVMSSAGNIYSYFIAGSAGGDVVTSKDQIPIRTDSTFGVRFINLSYNSTTVNVVLSSSPNTNEFSNISYKTLTDFKGYAATYLDPPTYTFEVTDPDGNILASTDVNRSNILVQKNITLVFSGEIGGSGSTAPILFINNNY